MSDERPRKPKPPARPYEILDAFDLHAGMRRLVLRVADGQPWSYRPGNDLVFLLPLPGEAVGRRHYTIRDHDPATGRTLVDVVMHGPTPGPVLAREARPGDRLMARGPRGATWLRPEADWHLFSGDETALPAILHMIDTLPAGARALALLEVADAGWEMPVSSRADVGIDWLHRGGPCAPTRLRLDRLQELALPEGHGVAYLLGETATVRAERHHLLERGWSRGQIVSEGYWRPGREGGHDHIPD